MHRPLLSAAFLLLVFSVPLSAQRGGSHSSAGARGGTSARGGLSGRGGSAHVSASMRSGSRSAPRRFNRNSSLRATNSARGLSRFHNRRFNNFTLRNNCYGYRCRGFGYPWGYAGAFDPYWWWDSGSTYDDDRERDLDMANDMNAQSLEQQSMRGQYLQDDPPARPAPQQPGSEAAEQPALATVLVFQDQHRQEIQNYAIVGQTLWNFASQRTQKIPLSVLDLPATTKANDERGVDFRVPSPNAGQ